MNFKTEKRGNYMKILMFVLVILANIMGFLLYKKKKSIYSAGFAILFLAFVFGGFGSGLALLITRDAFSIFYGFQIAEILILNSVIVFFIAIFVSIWKKIRQLI